jgi:hypothetical protein
MERRSEAMFDNSMTGAVGFALHEERLARARRNLLLSEAEQASTGKRTRCAWVRREVLARGLVTLAGRRAPSVTLARTGSEMLAR